MTGQKEWQIMYIHITGEQHTPVQRTKNGDNRESTEVIEFVRIV